MIYYAFSIVLIWFKTLRPVPSSRVNSPVS